MHLLHLTPAYVDEQMLLSDFIQSCDWIDAQGG